MDKKCTMVDVYIVLFGFTVALSVCHCFRIRGLSWCNLGKAFAICYLFVLAMNILSYMYTEHC